jgi:hypothetical protein
VPKYGERCRDDANIAVGSRGMDVSSAVLRRVTPAVVG